MRIKVKILYSDRYKDEDTFADAIERWQLKGWHLADTAQDFAQYGNDGAAILWRAV